MNPKIIAARWYFGDLNPEEWPQLSCEFLETGFDGRCLRLLAGLDKPTRADIEEVVPGALNELGIAVPMNECQAGIILAKEEVRCMLDNGCQPHEIACQLWYMYGS